MNTCRSFRSLKGLLVSLLLSLSPITAVQAQDSQFITAIDPPESILFVGNSFTFYNNSVYTHLRKLLVADDPSSRGKIFLKSMTISGALLSDHRDGLMQVLSSREWDVLVLQGQSRELLDEKTAPGFKSTVRTYSDAIRSRGAEPVLFMTWAYADKPEMSVQLANEFRQLGKKMDIPVIPVGLAFKRALEELPGVVLHAADQKHPSLEGTYLAAAVFYSALYGKSPVALNYSAGLDDNIARQLRQTAWQTVIEYFPAR